MTQKLKQDIEVLLKNGEYAEAEKLLEQITKANPKDWEAKLLFGTCRMMQGDVETAKRIHDEAEKHYECGIQIAEKEKNFWQKYHRWIIYGILGSALVFTGVVCYEKIGSDMNRLDTIMIDTMSVKYAAPPVVDYSEKYGGARYYDLHHKSDSVAGAVEHPEE